MPAPILPRFLLTVTVATLVLISGCGGSGSGGDSYSPPGGEYPGPSPGPGTPVAPPVNNSTYVRNFGSRGADEPVSMAALSNGGLALHGRFDQQSWLGVLDGAGNPVSEIDVVTADEANGFKFTTSAAVEDYGVLFAGGVTRTGTGRDIVVRYRRNSGGTVWERVLDAGAWSGSVNADNGILDDSEPRIFPTLDTLGEWTGVWIAALSEANVPYTNSEGERRNTHRRSVTLWHLDANGTQVSRTRMIHVPAPADGDVLLRSAAVLDTGSLAVLLGEPRPNSSGFRQVVRRVGRDGTIGSPLVEVPSAYGQRLFSVRDALLVTGILSVARIDISAQSIPWRTQLHLSQTSYETGAATRVDRNGRAELYLAGATRDGESMLLGMNLDTGVEFGGCSFSPDERLLSLRGRDSGNLRALILGADGVLRSANLAWNCSTVDGTVEEHGAMLTTVSPSDGTLAAFALGELNQYGDAVHKLSPRRVVRQRVQGVQEYDVSAQESLDVRYHSVAAALNSEFALLGHQAVQRRSGSGALVRAEGLPGISSAVYDDTGRLWATGLPGNFDDSDSQCSGVTVLHTDRAECLQIPGRDLRGWEIARGQGSGVWVYDSLGGGQEVLNLPGDGTAVVYTGPCAFGIMDVATGRVRAGSGRAQGNSAICREGGDERGWQLTLNSSAFNGALEIDSYAPRTVPASDGGVAVFFSVRQTGAVAGLRTNANITGDADLALLKLDADGNPRWLRVYGAAREELAYQLVRMADGGYAMSGTSDSLDAVTPGSLDIIVVRTGPDGYVGRTTDGGDSCQACLGSITGEALRQVVSAAQGYTVTRSAPVTLTSTPVNISTVVPVTVALRGETHGRSCVGNVTDVQEAPAGGTPTGGGTGNAPVARFEVLAQYAGAGATPIANRDPARFDGRASTPNTLQRWQWDFEDDGIFDAEGVAQVYTYPSRGTKTARLRVTAANGLTAETVREFIVAAAPDYYIRVLPVHAAGVPGNRIERVGGGISCQNQGDGSVTGACFANGSNAAGAESVLRATPAAGSAWSRWTGCDLTRVQAEGPPLCVLTGDPDGRERLVEAHFASN